jgi:hypothetical protein
VAKIPKQSLAENDHRATPPLPDASASSRWAFINGWKVEPQSNDRAPVAGDIVTSMASPAAQRSTVRRKQQKKFKEWSQDRHD